MHRETLSRSLFYSHNLIGKSVVTYGCARNVALTARSASSSANFNRQILNALSPSRCYHRSWEKTAQPGTQTMSAAEFKEPGLPDPAPSSGDNKTKHFNLKAVDILSTPDESVAPSKGKEVSEDEGHSIVSRSQVETKIMSARTVEELLNLSSEQDLTLRHACFIVSRLGQLAQPSKQFASRIQQDKRFVRVFNLIQRGNHSQYPHTLLQALTGLQKLGLDGSEDVSRLLERELSWSMRRCPLKFLAKAVRILNDNVTPGKVSASSTGDPNVIDSAVQVLHRRWIEAISGSDFISLFQITDLLDDERKLKLEERAADVAHQFAPSEMIKIFVILATKKRRPTPLLRAMAFHYSKSGYKLNVKEAIELIYALNELSFADPILMDRLCSDVAQEIPRIKNVALISSLVTSLGQMRYKQKDILLAVDEWISKHLNTLRVFDFASWLQAAATLDYSSASLPSFCQKAQEVLTKSAPSSPTEWVNIVHSFVVLNYFENDMLTSVLSPSFVESLEKLGPRSNKQKLKLLNLNHLAREKQGKGYKGPLLPDDLVKEWTSNLVCSSDDQFSKLVVDSLGSFLPPAKYLELNKKLESGIFIDAKCYVDSKMTPVTIADAKSKTSSIPTRQVAFVVESYATMCLGLKQRTGQSALNQRILESQNFIVLTVPYTEFGYTEKLVRRVQYLEHKLKAISESSDPSQSPKDR